MERPPPLARAQCGPVRSFVRWLHSPLADERAHTGPMTAGTATCAFPDCDRPVAPPPPTGGRSSYCASPDHNRTTAFAVRRAEAAGRAPAAPETPSAAQSGVRTAETLAEVADRLGQTLTAIEQQVGR